MRAPDPTLVASASNLHEFPLGRIFQLADDRYRITAVLAGTPVRGLYAGECVHDPTRHAHVSLGLRQTVAWDEGLAALALPPEGFAPILGIARIEEQGTTYDALLERRPAGLPLPELARGPMSRVHAARLLLPIVEWVAGAHREGRVVVGLRPELVFAELDVAGPDDSAELPTWGTRRPRATGLVPRCERFLTTAERPCYGFGPPFEELYLAPEVLAVRRPGPAADVFTLAAILAWLTAGEYPFAADTLVARMHAIMTGSWPREAVPAELRPLLSASLLPDPAARPTITEMRDWLAELGAS